MRGLAPKEISVKNLANIIQARMSEIMDFVSYHLKQVGLDSRMLNGGIILTGGGSQLKHLLQLTEYLTGLNARIGYPNEHLAGDYNEDLAMPMYSTCIGLILKGYNDFENKQKQMSANYLKMNKAEIEELAKHLETQTTIKKEENTEIEIAASGSLEEEQKGVRVGGREKLTKFLDNIKNNIIDMFKEEEEMKF